jgi:hypothetical protein
MTDEQAMELRKKVAKAIFDVLFEYSDKEAELPRDVVINGIADAIDFAGFLAHKYDLDAAQFVQLCAVVVEERWNIASVVIDQWELTKREMGGDDKNRQH